MLQARCAVGGNFEDRPFQPRLPTSCSSSCCSYHPQVLQHRDEEGCARVAVALRDMPQASVLVVGQASGFATRAIDAADVVVKSGGAAAVQLGE